MTSARVITAAALIMVFVFGSFVLNGDPTVKQFGIGLAVAVILDATVVRCLLVPALMILMGRINWYFPQWMERVVPRHPHRGRRVLRCARRRRGGGEPAPTRRRWPAPRSTARLSGCRPDGAWGGAVVDNVAGRVNDGQCCPGDLAQNAGSGAASGVGGCWSRVVGEGGAGGSDGALIAHHPQCTAIRRATRNTPLQRGRSLQHVVGGERIPEAVEVKTAGAEALEEGADGLGGVRRGADPALRRAVVAGELQRAVA